MLVVFTSWTYILSTYYPILSCRKDIRKYTFRGLSNIHLKLSIYALSFYILWTNKIKRYKNKIYRSKTNMGNVLCTFYIKVHKQSTHLVCKCILWLVHLHYIIISLTQLADHPGDIFRLTGVSCPSIRYQVIIDKNIDPYRKHLVFQGNLYHIFLKTLDVVLVKCISEKLKCAESIIEERTIREVPVTIHFATSFINLQVVCFYNSSYYIQNHLAVMYLI